MTRRRVLTAPLGGVTFCVFLFVLAVGTGALYGDARRQQRRVPDTAPAEVPLTIVSAGLSADQSELTFTVQNNGAKAVTAWDVQIVAGQEPTAWSGGWGTDSYRSFAGLGANGTHILPGGVVTVTARTPEARRASPATVMVTPTTAVFADNSFAGDSKSAEFILQRRAVQRDAWRDIISALERVRAAGQVNEDGLESVRSRLDAYLSRNEHDIVRVIVRSNLSSALTEIREGRASAPAKFDELLADATSNLAAATAHTRR